MRCLRFLYKRRYLYAPSRATAREGFFMPFFKCAKKYLAQHKFFLPLNKLGLKSLPRKNFTVGVNFSAVFQQSNIEGEKLGE